MKKSYMLHFEGSEGDACEYATKKDVRDAIRDAAKACGISIKDMTRSAYIMTRAEWEAEHEEVSGGAR